MAKTVYDPAVKAAALAALLQGQSLNKVAEEFKLPVGTVKAWRSRVKGNASESRAVADRREEIGALVVEYLYTNLQTLRAQMVAFGDVEWLKKQNAADVAVLHGVMTDKAIRLLEALGGKPTDTQGEPQPPETGGHRDALLQPS